MKVQQMRLYGKRLHLECRAISHICYRIKAFVRYASASYVNPVFRNQLFVPAQIDGGNRVLGTVSSPPARRGKNTEWTSQKMPRPADSSLSQQFANLTARDGFSPQLHLGIDLHLESHFTPELSQQIDVASGLMAEAEVVAFVYFARPQSFFEDLLGELPWRHERQVASEWEQEDSVQPSGFEKAQF